MNVAELIVCRLEDAGVEVLFTVPGEQMDPLFGALACSRIRVVHTRHEQGAAYMAYGYARSTGRVAAFAVISGPGLLNAGAGLAMAYAGGARVICVAGQVSTNVLGRGYGVPHEIRDQLGVMRGLTKWSGRVGCADEAITVLDSMISELTSGRPRPVGIEVPSDVLDAAVNSVTERAHGAPQPCGRSAPDADAIATAARALAGARSPMIFVGSGAVGAGPEIAQLAEILAAPVTSELGGRGVVDDRHMRAIPFAAAHRLWPDTDVVLAIGTRFMRPQVEWGLDRHLTVIRVDLDSEEINRVAAPAIAIVADAQAATRALLVALRGADLVPRAGTDRGVAARASIEAEVATLQPQVAYLDAMRAALPDDGFFVDELTQIGYAARVAFPVTRARQYISATYQGTLGFGFATALGVKLANPRAPVLSISGDGGFLYTASELATAVQHGINIVAVVFNDGAYGNVRRSHLRLFGTSIGTALHNPDYVQLARAFGAFGARVAGPAELGDAISVAFERGTAPTVIEVPVGEMPSPWPLIRLPRVRSDVDGTAP